MEAAILERMRSIRSALAHNLTDHFDCHLSQGYEKADGFIINVCLNRARNRGALLDALSRITREAGRGFSQEELEWILETSKRNPIEVRSLLILACRTHHSKKSEEAPQKESAESTGTEELPDNL